MGFLEFLGLREVKRTEPQPIPFGARIVDPGSERLHRSDLYDTQVSDFWDTLASSAGATNPTLLDRVWVANRCLHMNANAISTMPLRHYGGRKPAWVSAPDPVWYPNGIADAVYSIVSSYYGYGDAFVYITSRYADGYPSGFTVLDPAPVTVEVKNGRRVYRSGQTPLNEDDVVQISRDPRAGKLKGTSSIASYSAYSNGLLAASDLGRVMMGSGATPHAVIKTARKATPEQAAKIQLDWMTATASRRGAPAVLDPDLSFEKLAFSPSELMLLDVQTFDSTVLATAFGVPPQLVNMSVEGGGLNYQTPILLLEQWWRTELVTTCSRVAQALSAQMLPAGQYVKFDPYEFLRPSWKELVEGWLAIIEAGAGAVEEFRTVVLGLPPEAQQALEALSTPPSAGASPAQQPAGVVELRPTSSGSTY